MPRIQNKNLQKVWMKRAGKAAKAVPYAKASVMGIKAGEYAVYLIGSKTPFVTIFLTV